MNSNYMAADSLRNSSTIYPNASVSKDTCTSFYFDNKKIFGMPQVQQHGSHMIMKNGGSGGGCEGVGGCRKLYVSFDTRFSNDIVGSVGVGTGDRADYNSSSHPHPVCVTTNTSNASAFKNASASYNFVLPVRLTNIKSMSVTNVEMPISYYNISAALGNNTFRVTRVASGNVWTVSLSDGQYSMGGLQSAINAGLPAALTFSINSQGQSVFTNNTDISGSAYYVEFYTDTLGGYDKNNPKFKLGWIMGFRYVAYPIPFGSGLVSECILNLHGPRYLYLVVDEFQNGKENTFNSALGTGGILKKNILARIAPCYSEYPYGTIMPANLSNGALTTDCRTYNRGKVDIQRLNVQLVNEIGQVMCLNGGHVMFCLELELADESG